MIFFASPLAERDYARPPQFLKDFLKKNISILAARLSGLDGNGPRDFRGPVCSKISLKPVAPHGSFNTFPGTLSLRKTEGFSSSVEIVVEIGADFVRSKTGPVQ